MYSSAHTSRLTRVAVVLCATLSLTVPALASSTVATFADPNFAVSEPTNWLFTLDYANDQITGGWDDAWTGLNLEVEWPGAVSTYENAYMILDSPISYSGDAGGGVTGGGALTFYADGAIAGVDTPLLKIVFDSGFVTAGPAGVGGQNIFAPTDHVQISGLNIAPMATPLTQDASFSFAFNNQTDLNGDPDEGAQVTGNFTSSATPEPASLMALIAGSTVLVLRRRHS